MIGMQPLALKLRECRYQRYHKIGQENDWESDRLCYRSNTVVRRDLQPCLEIEKLTLLRTSRVTLFTQQFT